MCEEYLALNTIFNLSTLHVFPGYLIVEHEFLNLDVVQGSNRRFLRSSVNDS